LLFHQELGHCLVPQLLLLLVQQLHLVTPQLRSIFLHSPAGNTVLQVLSEMSSDIAVQKGEVLVLYRIEPLGAAGLLELLQTDGDMQGQWGYNTTNARTLLVQQLLLPGLLLQPKPQLQAPWRPRTAGTSSSSTSCSRSRSSSTGVAQRATSSTGPLVSFVVGCYGSRVGVGSGGLATCDSVM
jgi:hypothetical protein